ncbi:MAG: hypothetical protein WAO07_16390, partial [Desulfobacterales bacterium]
MTIPGAAIDVDSRPVFKYDNSHFGKSGRTAIVVAGVSRLCAGKRAKKGGEEAWTSVRRRCGPS